MSYWYPQCCVKLRILPEDFQLVSDPTLGKVYEVIVTPRNMTLGVNDHKTCDTFTLDLDYKSFPFDPRAIRYCGVVIYIKDMGSLSQTITADDDNAVFSGFVDEDTVTFDDGKQTVHFEGRDFSGLLIDQKYKENVPIDVNKPLDVAIGAFLSQFPATKSIVIKDGNLNDIVKGSLPTIATYYKGNGDHLGGMVNPSAHDTYWDIIQRMINQAGLIGYMFLNALVIRDPINRNDPKADAKFIYGKNVKSLTMKRKLGRLRNFNIKVRSRVGTEVNEVRIPLEANPDWCKLYDIKQEEIQIPVLNADGSLGTQSNIAPYITFPVAPDVAKHAQLVLLGQSAYEDYSLQQLEGSLETRDMLTHSESNPEIDLTKLDIGTPISIEIDTDDLAKISRFADVDVRTQYLIERNYSRDIAAAFATSMGKFSQRFYTKSYSLQMGQDTGFSLKIEFLNILKLTNRGLN